MSKGLEAMKNKKERLQSILALWGFKENLEIKAEDIGYETEREVHIWTVNEDYITYKARSENATVRNNRYGEYFHS